MSTLILLGVLLSLSISIHTCWRGVKHREHLKKLLDDLDRSRGLKPGSSMHAAWQDKKEEA